jgi:hypothetical protein
MRYRVLKILFIVAVTLAIVLWLTSRGLAL